MEIVAWFVVGVFVGWLVSEAKLTPNLASIPVVANPDRSGAKSLSQAERHDPYRAKSLVWRPTHGRTTRT